jgi:branched-chain amino acid transport system permease protein
MRQRLQDLDWIGLVLWIFRAVIIILIIWGTVATLIENPYTARQWTDIIIFGIAQGSMYALIAICL